jgi:hypothetical protein
VKKELDEALMRDFPKTLGQRNWDMTETCMCWGFECGDGWEALLRKALTQLEKLNESLPLERPIQATQIKEKYGTLRFYLNHYTDEASAIVKVAEAASEVTCETCGEPGKLRGRGWCYTACDAHTKESDK